LLRIAQVNGWVTAYVNLASFDQWAVGQTLRLRIILLPDNELGYRDIILGAGTQNLILNQPGQEFVLTGLSPESIATIPGQDLLMNQSLVLNGSDYFAGAVSYSLVNSVYFSYIDDNAGHLTIIPEAGWYGTEQLTVRATSSWGGSIDQQVWVVVRQSSTSTENFDHNGEQAPGYTIGHSGSTSEPWNPVLIDSPDYAMRTSSTLGASANERLLSGYLDLTNLTNVVVNYDSDFVPYGNATGVFAYSFNNVIWTPIETMNSAFSGTKSYSIPALSGKPQVKFRWLYSISTINSGQLNHWIVDNFQVLGVVRDITAPIAVSDLSVNGYTETSISLQWTPSSDTYFREYRIYYSTDETVNGSDPVWNSTNDPSLASAGANTTSITGLTPGMYWIALQAIDFSNNVSEMSNVVAVVLDTTAPLIGEPIPGPQPYNAWFNTPVIPIGCVIQDNLFVASVQYRVDSNANGSYDPAEVWLDANVIARQDRNGFYASAVHEFPHNGIYPFEFKAMDLNGNTAYSGVSCLEGIADDWIVAIDTSAPQLSDPLPSNQIDPVWLSAVNPLIGLTIADQSGVNSVYYRLDADSNGGYDADETWNQISLRSTNGRYLETLQHAVGPLTTGVYNFEFKVVDNAGNLAYSGTSGLEGIADDWLLRLDMEAPLFSNPVPGDQPLPLWTNSSNVSLGSTLEDLSGLSELMIRYDLNLDGEYGPGEDWNPLMVRSSHDRQGYLIMTNAAFPGDGVYHWEMKAVDMAGNVSYSGTNFIEGIADDWVARIDTTLPAVIDNFFISEIADASVTLSWTPTIESNFAVYEIYYATEAGVNLDDLLWSDSHDSSMTEIGTGLKSTTITGLGSGTRYYFRIRALDLADNACPLADEITAVTTGEFPPQPPANVILAINDNDLVINWDPVTEDVNGSPVTISRYDIYISDYPDFEPDPNSWLGSTTDTTIGIEDIDELDRLFIRVVAVSGAIGRDRK